MATPSTASRRRKAPAAAPEAAEPARVALTPADWVDTATGVLADHGIDHLRVDELARTLKVTRGSFYWHFRDREDLLRSVLAAWRQRSTEQLTARLQSASEDPREQLRDLMSLPFRGRSAARAARIELAIRAWARRDDMAREAVEEADRLRMAYIAQVFGRLGFARDEAGHRAFLLYSYMVAQSLMPKTLTGRARDERDRYVEALLQKK